MIMSSTSPLLKKLINYEFYLFSLSYNYSTLNNSCHIKIIKKHEFFTPVKIDSRCVRRAILRHLKWSITEWSAGETISKVGLFRKYLRNLLLSLRAASPEEYDICK